MILGRKTGLEPAANEKGFTMIEMLVASLVLVVALAALMSFLQRDERARETSNYVLESRQNARAALDFIVSEVRMAGSGVAIPVTTSDAYGDSVKLYPITPDSLNGTYEIFTLVEKNTDAETVLGSAMPTPASAINVADTAGFAEGDLMVVTNGAFANLFEVTWVDGGGSNLEHGLTSEYNQSAGHKPWPPGGYAVGSRVVRVDVITYYVDRSDSTCPAIMRKVWTEEPRVISEFVNTMEILYELQDHTVVAVPPDPTLIRNVLITIEAASVEPGGRHVTRLVSSATPRCM
jgi:prepilin-type N-terminal cleavage/methylation domain-containing protein